MLFPRIPETIAMRPLKWAVIATHTVRDRLDDIDVDLTKAEQAINQKLEALSVKLDNIMERLAAYEEDTIDGEQSIPAGSKKAGTRQGKAKGKAKTAGRRARAKG